MRVVAIEEHHVIPETSTALNLPGVPAETQGRVRVIPVAERLADMDAAGIDLQVLSVVLPMPRMLPAEIAVPLAEKANQELRDMVTAHPDRFAAFATLPVTVPDAAAAELERAVSELGFVGAMIHGTTGGRFLDDPFFQPVLETAARLNVPLYLHPAPPPKPVMDAYYSGFENPAVNVLLATGAYGWHYETSLHAVRLIAAGVFDRLPGLKVILGHLGEGIPFHLPRIDEKLTAAAGLARPVSDYFREHFWITTAGYFYDGPFRLTQETFGDDRLMFSVDYPFADNKRATDWFDGLDLTPEAREKIAHATADTLLRLR